MTKVNGAVLLVAMLACESGEQGDRDAAPRLADTARVQDTAAAVGDSVMARDTTVSVRDRRAGRPPVLARRPR